MYVQDIIPFFDRPFIEPAIKRIRKVTNPVKNILSQIKKRYEALDIHLIPDV